MSERLEVLHYNVGRQKHVQWSMLSDEAYARFAALAVVEPYVYSDPGTGEVRCGSHSSWQPFTPSLQREHSHTQFAYRAMMWVNNACKAVQVPIPSHDVVAVSIVTSAGTVLVISAYDPNYRNKQTENRQILEQKLAHIRRAIDEANARVGGEVEIVLCSDFNRHHCLWGRQGCSKAKERRRTSSSLCSGVWSALHVASWDDHMATRRIGAILFNRCDHGERKIGDSAGSVQRARTRSWIRSPTDRGRVRPLQPYTRAEAKSPSPREGGLGTDWGGGSTETRVCVVTSRCHGRTA